MLFQKLGSLGVPLNFLANSIQIGHGKKIYSKTKEIGFTSIIVQNIELALRDKLSPLLFSLFTANLGFILANCGAEPFFLPTTLLGSRDIERYHQGPTETQGLLRSDLRDPTGKTKIIKFREGDRSNDPTTASLTERE